MKVLGELCPPNTFLFCHLLWKFCLRRSFYEPGVSVAVGTGGSVAVSVGGTGVSEGGTVVAVGGTAVVGTAVETLVRVGVLDVLWVGV